MAVIEQGRMRGSEGFPRNTEKPFQQIAQRARETEGISAVYQAADSVVGRSLGSSLGYGRSLTAFFDYVGAKLQGSGFDDMLPLATETEAGGTKDNTRPSIPNMAVALAVGLVALQEGGIPAEGMSTSDLLSQVSSDNFTFSVPQDLLAARGTILPVPNYELNDLQIKIERESPYFMHAVDSYVREALKDALQSDVLVARVEGDMVRACTRAAVLTYRILRGPFEEGEGAGERSPLAGDPHFPPRGAAVDLPGRRPAGVR